MLAAKHDLTFQRPYLNRAGFLGFAPAPQSEFDHSSFAAFITNPISLRPRTPATPPRLLRYSGGFLLHTGHPNPGLRATVKRFRRRWENSPLPIIVHLLAEDPDLLSEAMQIMEQIEGVMGVEIGLPPEIDRQGLKEITQSAQGELPIVVQVQPDGAGPLAQEAILAGAAAVSIGPPRGALPGPSGQPVSGRLYGPATFPLVLGALSNIGNLDVPLIAGGGVLALLEAETLMEAGAAAVMLDSVLWKPGGNLL